MWVILLFFIVLSIFLIQSIPFAHLNFGGMLASLLCIVLAVDSIGGFIDCPSDMPSAAIAVKVNDDAMMKSLEKGSYVFVEFNSPLNSKDYGLFNYNNGELPCLK